MKRTITFIAKNLNHTKTHTKVVNISRVKRTRFIQRMVKTDFGYVDLSVTLDRWGRLIDVSTERSRQL